VAVKNRHHFRHDAPLRRTESGMRHLAFAVALLTALAAGNTARAAELEIPPLSRPSQNVSMQKGPANCGRWTDECVNCTRGAEGEAPVCSNIGFACQPKAIRCLSAGTSK
jgi:hypothetical protein